MRPSTPPSDAGHTPSSAALPYGPLPVRSRRPTSGLSGPARSGPDRTRGAPSDVSANSSRRRTGARHNVGGSMETTSAELRVAHTLVMALLGELRANPRACEELSVLLNEHKADDRLLSPTEAAGRLGVHPKTLTRAAAAGRVAGARRVGRHWRFDPAELALEPLHHAARRHRRLSRGCARVLALGLRTRFGPAGPTKRRGPPHGVRNTSL